MNFETPSKVPMFDGHDSLFLNKRNTLELLHQFYLINDVSRICPDKNGFVHRFMNA